MTGTSTSLPGTITGAAELTANAVQQGNPMMSLKEKQP